MTNIVAAAVHKGWISVTEGILDTLDCDSFLEDELRAKYKQMSTERLWSRWLAEAYLDPSLPGETGFEPGRWQCLCSHECVLVPGELCTPVHYT